MKIKQTACTNDTKITHIQKEMKYFKLDVAGEDAYKHTETIQSPFLEEKRKLLIAPRHIEKVDPAASHLSSDTLPAVSRDSSCRKESRCCMEIDSTTSHF